MIDLTEYDETQLVQLRRDITDELLRRATLDDVTAMVDELAKQWFDAYGIKEGDPWAQPFGAFDAYPKGWRALHKGKLWESLIPSNVWEPGVSGWREVEPGAS